MKTALHANGCWVIKRPSSGDNDHANEDDDGLSALDLLLVTST